MSRRTSLLAVPAALAFALAGSAPTWAQDDPGTGIALVLADWLDPWEEGGGWIAVPAGGGFGKGASLINDMAAELAPGAYDLYWVQDDDAEPLPMAMDVVVVAGERTEHRITTGIALEVADWVQPRDPETGIFGVLLPETLDFDFYARSATADTLFLPPGDYYVYYDIDGDDDRPPTYIGAADVEEPFGGLGIEIAIEGDNVVIVRTLPGGPAELGGLQAGDIIVSVDGIALAGMELLDAGNAIRGGAGTEAEIAVSRNKESLTFSVVRSTVEPHRTVSASSGIQILTEVGVLQPEGWWGVAYAGDRVSRRDDLAIWKPGSENGPMLLAPVAYDLYWSPDGTTAPILIEAGVNPDGELIEISVDSPD